ncbi:tetratricopeptide repeat protein [Deltaproteobacteria bacterium]|nr:tetratricopeptide repeat protein [Deltaproteobacteria bacterium]
MKDKKSYSYFDTDLSFLAGLLLFFITFALFAPVINHEFIHLDDPFYITQNDMVKKGLTLEGLIWAFTDISAGFWFPLTWLSHMLDCQIFGLNPDGHHFTSLLLHSINSLMLFYLFRRMTGALLPSLLVAAIFAVHPLHVEPVVWASSRKDVLSTFFWILTMWSYTYYVKQGGFKRYLLVLLSFSMGLMAKPMLVTLPFVLILMDYWPLFRLDAGQSSNKPDSQAIQSTSINHSRTHILKLITEKIPLFILSLISISITYIAEKNLEAIVSFEIHPLSARLTNAIISYIGYINKTILPVKLSVHYPRPDLLPSLQITNYFFFIILITFLAIKTHRRYPYFLFGWLWFLGTLVPVIGLIQIGSHSMADRYSYIPLIGLSIVFSWGLHHIFIKLRIIKIYPLISCTVILPLIILTNIQLSYWQNGIDLFKHALDVDSGNVFAEYNLGLVLANNGREMDAIAHFYRALGVRGLDHKIFFNLGNSFLSLGQDDLAISHYKYALEIDPDYIEALNNLGLVFYQLGRYDEAAHYFSRVLQINPNHASAHNNLGVIMSLQNRVAGAAFHFKEAIKTDPNNIMAIKNLEKIHNNQVKKEKGN